jgi:hypothetical protein
VRSWPDEDLLDFSIEVDELPTDCDAALDAEEVMVSASAGWVAATASTAAQAQRKEAERMVNSGPQAKWI